MKSSTLHASTLSILSAMLFCGCSTLINPADPAGNPSSKSTPARSSCLTVPVIIKVQDVAHIVNGLAPQSHEGTEHVHSKIPIPDGVKIEMQKKGPIKVPVPVPQFREVNGPEIFHVDYGVSRGEISLSASGDRLSISVPIHAHAKEVPGSLKAEINGSVHGSTTLSVRPDYNLDPSINLAVNIDDAKVGPISIKGIAQSKVDEALNSIKGSLNEKVSKAVNLKQIAQRGWDKIPDLVSVPNAKNLWIRINPEAVMLDGPHAANDTVTGVLALQVKVETLFESTKPESPKRNPLPNLTTPPSDRKFHLALPVKANVSELNRALSSAVKGKDNGKIDLGNGEVVTIKAVTLFPRGNQLFLKVGFVGNHGFWSRNLRGTLIFGATPRLDTARQILSFQNIDYTADTKSTLKGAALEFATWLLKPVVVDQLQKRLVVKVSPQLDKAKTDANKLASNIQFPPPLQLKFNLEKLEAQDIAVYGDNLYLDFDAAGSARMEF